MRVSNGKQGSAESVMVSEGFLQALSGVWGNPLKREHGVPKEERGVCSQAMPLVGSRGSTQGTHLGARSFSTLQVSTEIQPRYTNSKIPE